MKHDHSPPFGGEAAQRCIDDLAICDACRVVGDSWGVERRELDLDGPVAPAARYVEAGPDGGPVEPGVET
jgi:hypothetical protein